MVEVVKFGAVNRKATCKSRIWNPPIAPRAVFLIYSNKVVDKYSVNLW